MADDNGNNSVFRQIIVTVVIALLVGGTSPWWWTIVFPPPAQPTSIPQPIPTRVPPASRFDGTSTDGWAVVAGGLRNPGSDGRGGGANNGFLRAEDYSDGRTSYYRAPSTYNGNWNDYSELRFDLWSSGGEYYTSGHEIRGDIYLANGSMTALRMLSDRPGSSWEHFDIPLNNDGGEWVFGGGATSLRDVLDNVTQFEIRAEFGVGVDTTGLDNVVLVR